MCRCRRPGSPGEVLAGVPDGAPQPHDASEPSCDDLRRPCQVCVVFEHFTDEARRVLVLAQEEARLLKRSSVGTEHLLLGFLREADGAAARALDSLGITLKAARERVKEATQDSETALSGALPYTREAKRVLIELSPREATQLGHGYIGTEHLLLGILLESGAVADHVLISLGADIASVRERVIQFIPGQE